MRGILPRYRRPVKRKSPSSSACLRESGRIHASGRSPELGQPPDNHAALPRDLPSVISFLSVRIPFRISFLSVISSIFKSDTNLFLGWCAEVSSNRTNIKPVFQSGAPAGESPRRTAYPSPPISSISFVRSRTRSRRRAAFSNSSSFAACFISSFNFRIITGSSFSEA